MRTTKRLMISLLLLLILLLGVACQAPQTEAADSEAEQPETEVQRQIELYGTVVVNQSRDISLDKTIEVVEVFVKEGQAVKRGDALFSVALDDLRSDAKLLEQKIAVAEQQQQDGDFDYKKAGVNVAQLADKLADAKKTLEQNRVLLEAGAISQREFDQSAQVVSELRSSLAAAQYDVSNIADKDDSFTQSKSIEIAEYRRQYDQIMAILNNELIVDDAVVSPLENAVVSQLHLTPGGYLNAFTPALALDDLSNLVIKADVIEEQVASIERGQKVTIKPIMAPDQELTGTIDFISSRAKIVNNETVVPIEISVEDNSVLIPNINVDIIVPLDDE